MTTSMIEHSRAFSPIPELSPAAGARDQVARWNWIFETEVEAALSLYLLVAIAAILAL